jgi:DNA-binding MarR family transcriptional regulator
MRGRTARAYCCVVQATVSSPPAAVCPALDTTSTLVADLFRIARRLRRSGGPAQIDIAALMLLHRLAFDGPKRSADLAADVGLDTSTVSRHVKALDDAGLVTREPDPADGRSFRLSVTSRGTEEMVAALQRRERSVEEALRPWEDADVAVLRTLLGRLADDLERIGEETR